MHLQQEWETAYAELFSVALVASTSTDSKNERENYFGAVLGDLLKLAALGL